MYNTIFQMLTRISVRSRGNRRVWSHPRKNPHMSAGVGHVSPFWRQIIQGRFCPFSGPPTWKLWRNYPSRMFMSTYNNVILKSIQKVVMSLRHVTLDINLFRFCCKTCISWNYWWVVMRSSIWFLNLKKKNKKHFRAN